jgi:hypothetical protein
MLRSALARTGHSLLDTGGTDLFHRHGDTRRTSWSSFSLETPFLDLVILETGQHMSQGLFWWLLGARTVISDCYIERT